MAPIKPTREELERLYLTERKSSVAIAPLYGVQPRTIRQWMTDLGIKSLGQAHLRKGVSAHWNKGRQRTPEHREKLRKSRLGKRPVNFGQGRVYFNCEACGVGVFDKPYRRKRVCSLACRNHLSHALRGELHWNYKSELTAATQRKRNWAEYRDWRKAVLKRCKRTCARCGVKRRRITAHHLYTWNDHPELRFDPANGAALCWSCHCAFHSATSSRHTTPEMFQAWLSEGVMGNATPLIGANTQI